jgi:hypothetical protein
VWRISQNRKATKTKLSECTDRGSIPTNAPIALERAKQVLSAAEAEIKKAELEDEIEISAVDTFKTSRPAVTMSEVGCRPEVTG